MPDRKVDDALVNENITHLKWLSKKLEDTDDDLLKELLHHTIEMLMGAETDVICGAEYRKGHLNE